MAPALAIAARRAPFRAFRRRPTWSWCRYVRPRPVDAGDSLRQVFNRPIELGPRKIPIRIGPAHEREQLVHVPILRGDLGHDLLRQNVQRRLGNSHAVEQPPTHGPEQGERFHQFVSRQRHQPALRNQPQRMARAADPLQERRDRAGRADLDHQVDVPDVDAQLQRSGRHDGLELACLKLPFRLQPLGRRQRAVMAVDVSFTQLLRQLVRQPLGQTARVDEDQRRAVLVDQFDQAVVDFVPLLVRADDPQLGPRKLDPQIALPRMTHVDDLARTVRRLACGIRRQRRN